jgi:ubiquinone/menaquinone biosynthesis C-methylase UbiE
MSDIKTLNRRRLLLPEMEGAMARWYDRQRGTPAQIANYRRDAARLTAGLPRGARVLEVAPGPGYLSIEMARLERFAVSGLDISRTFVEVARDHARDARVSADFRHGDVAAMPFEARSFDFIVCQAAFKNFRRPVTALNEMHRVLRVDGMAVIDDMRRDASGADIDREVRQQALGAINRAIVKLILSNLRRRAYSRQQFEQLVAESEFRSGQLVLGGIGIEVRLSKAAQNEKGERHERN